MKLKDALFCEFRSDDKQKGLRYVGECSESLGWIRRISAGKIQAAVARKGVQTFQIPNVLF